MIDYPSLVRQALRHAIGGVLRQVAEEGLPGDHHFYITFRTDAEGVELPPALHRQYPDELTIILQHQFWNLHVDDDGFSVTLRFSGVDTHVGVPFAAMTAFADPSVEFGVQLALPPDADGAPDDDGEEEQDATGPVADGNVIAFDRDRKS